MSMFAGGGPRSGGGGVRAGAIPYSTGWGPARHHGPTRRHGAGDAAGCSDRQEFGDRTCDSRDELDVARRQASSRVRDKRRAEFHKATGAWGNRLETEHDNTRAALQCHAKIPDGARHGRSVAVLVLGGYVKRAWVARAHHQRGERFAVRRRARAMLGRPMYEAIGDDEADERRSRGIADWEALDDATGIALAFRHRATTPRRGRTPRRQSGREACRLGEQLNDEFWSRSVSNLGAWVLPGRLRASGGRGHGRRFRA